MRYKINIKMRSKLAWIFASLAFPFFAIAQNSATSDTKKSTEIQSFLKDSVTVPYKGKVSRSNVTSSMSTVKGEELRTLGNLNFSNALSGKLSGLYIGQNGGSPGNSNPDVNIRGMATFNDNSMIFLVDGFETKYSDMNLYDIETVSVLKDAASLSLYGLEGANGVVLITTKRGKASNKSKITFNSRFGIQSAAVLPSFLGNGDYAEMYNKALINDGKDISSGYFKTPEIVEYFKSGDYPYLYPDVDWQKEILQPTTTAQDYSLTFTGGSKAAKYFLSLGYNDYNGLYKGTDKKQILNSNYQLTRYNIRANVDVDITSFLSTEVSLRGTVADKFTPNTDENTIWKSMAIFNPFPVKAPNGMWGGMQGYTENSVASIMQEGYLSTNERTIDANVKFICKLDAITKGLRVSALMNFMNNYYSKFDKTRGFAYSELTPGVADTNGIIPYTETTRGNVSPTFSISQGTGAQWNRTSAVASIEYERQFGKNSFYLSTLYKQQVYKTNYAEMDRAKQNVFGQVSYNFDEKYFAEFSYSFSGSENFPAGKRFGFFPTVSAGWLLNKEDFLNQVKWIDLLKVRASTGKLGSDKIGSGARFIFNQYYGSQSNYNTGNNLSTANGTFNQLALANLNSTWEEAAKSNVGIDAILFRKLSLALDLFYEKRTGIYVSPANYIPSVMGASFNNVNLGIASNKGIEAEIEFRDRIGSFGYFVSGNVSYAKSNIIDRKEIFRPENENYLYAKGNPIGQPFILEAIGFFKDAADIADSPKQLYGTVIPGDVKYKDQNEDGFIDDNDKKPIGKSAIPELYYGANLGFDIFGFDVAVSIQGATNRSVSLLDNNNIIPFLNGGVKPTQWVKDNYWTPEKGDAAKFPRLTAESNTNNYTSSTLWQRDGSYLRIKSVELGYTLPATLSKALRLSSLRLYASGVNLFTLDKIDEISVDPEIMNMFTYPAMKSINFGLTVQF